MGYSHWPQSCHCSVCCKATNYFWLRQVRRVRIRRSMDVIESVKTLTQHSFLSHYYCNSVLLASAQKKVTDKVAARRLITRTKHERGLSWLQCCVIICTGCRFCSAAVQACRDCSSVGYRAPGYLADCCVPCSLRTPKFPAANISNSSAAVAREYGCRKL